MIDRRSFKDKYFWLIGFLITLITSLHYSNLMAEWELHLFYRKLYYIPIILSSFRYRLKGGIVASILISILYAPHLLIYTEKINISLINQYLEIILFISIGFITGRLVESDYKRQISLEKKVIEITRLQNYTKNIVDSIDSGVISIDNDYYITSINKVGEVILDIDDSTGIRITNVFEDQKVIDTLTQVKVQKRTVSNVKIDMNIANNKKHLILSISPLVDILDRIQGLVIVVEDRSRERFLEAQAIRADRLSAVGELASGIAHEIRNPMGIIKTISQVLQKENSMEDIKEGLEIIEKEIDRANKVIQSLLNFARPSENKVEQVSLKKILDDVDLIIGKYVKQKNVRMEINIKQEIIFLADDEKLKQVFINLILNAIQAIPDEGTIKINTDIRDNWVYISFVDNGIGISKENLKKVFNPFFTTKEKGTGLGLSISNRIIQDHHGYINVDSIEGEGTNIEVYLPLDREGTKIDEA